MAQPLPTVSEIADLWVVETADRQRYVARIYRYGFPAKAETLQQISLYAPPHLLRMLEQGHSDGSDYELLEYLAEGSLRQWFAQGPLPPESARILLEQLSSALAYLHQRDILHRDLKPDNVLIRQWQPLQIALSDFGVAPVTGLRTAATSSGALYQAPEVATGMASRAADYWAMGMILLEALTGKHPFAGLSGMVILYQLTARAVPMTGVEEPWLTLCRGLLQRDPQQRWGLTEVRDWLAGDTGLRAPVEMVTPEAMTFRPRPFYRLGSVECQTAPQLALQMAQHWQTAIKELAQGAMSDWLRYTLGDQKDDAARLALQILDDREINPDERLLRLITQIAPQIAPVWKEWSLDNDSLIVVARAAVNGDIPSQSLLLELLHGSLDILGIYATAGNQQCRKLQTAWQETVTEYEKTWQTVFAYGVPAKLRPDWILLLPDLLLATLSSSFQNQLRSEIATGLESVNQRPAWLDRLLQSSPQSGSALVLRAVLQWLPLSIAIEEHITPRLEALLKEFAILHRSTDFHNALNEFDQKVRDGSYGSLQIVEQALNGLRDGAQPLVDALRQYFALWQQTAMNSAACPVLRQWQTRAAAPRYADAPALRQFMMQPLRWRMSAEGWQRPITSALGWKHENTVLWSGLSKASNPVVFSADSRLLASGGGDRSVRLWRVDSGQRVAAWVGHSGAINALAFSPDGRWLASAGMDRVVRLWRVDSGQCAALWSGHIGNVNAVAFSPDGQWLASAGADRVVRLWRVAAGQCLATWTGHTGIINAVAFSPDGQWLASASIDRSVRVWRVDSGLCVAVLGRTGRINAVAFSPDGRWLASGSGRFSDRHKEDDAVRLWRLENRQCVATLPGHTDSVNAVAFSPDGRLLASGSADRSVRLWRLENRQCVATLAGHTGSVNAVAFSPDGRWLASGCDDGVVLWSGLQTVTVEMPLQELITWEKEHLGQYREITALE